MTQTITIVKERGARGRRRCWTAGQTARHRLVAVLVLSAIAGAGGSAARADWLVLASGDAVETKGPWKVEGRMVVFTTTRGVLSSIRASSVDLDSSHELTRRKHEEATRVVAPTPQPKREPVLRLTDADFADAPSPAAGGAATDAGGATPGTASSEPIVVPASDSLETRMARQLPGPASLQVMNWSVRPTDEDELTILGYVQNVGNLVTASVAITVTIYDSEGTQVGSTAAALSSTALMPGVQSFFEAKFPGAPAFATVEFSLSTVELALGRAGAASGEEADREGEPEAGGSSEDAREGGAEAPAADGAESPTEDDAPEGDGEDASGADLPDAAVRQAPPVQRGVRHAP